METLEELIKRWTFANGGTNCRCHILYYDDPNYEVRLTLTRIDEPETATFKVEGNCLTPEAYP